MKKIVKVLLFGFLIFSVVSFVSAETRTFTKVLSVGQTYNIPLTEYNGVSCYSNDSTFLNVSHVYGYRYFSYIGYDDGYRCSRNGYLYYSRYSCRRNCGYSYRYCYYDTDSYVYQRYRRGYVSANVSVRNTTAWIEADRTSTVTCTYSSKVSNPSSGGGTLIYNFTIKAYTENITFNLTKGLDESYNLFDRNETTGTYLISNMNRIENLANDTSRTTTGNSYLNTNCSRNSRNTCTFSIKSNMTASTPSKEANYKLKYLDNSGYYKQARIKVNIYPYREVTATNNSYGTCSFNSSWTKKNSKNYTTRLIIGNNITLPNCTANTGINPLLKFVGWINVENNYLNPKMEKVEECKSYVNVSPGQTISMTKKTGRIIACYEYDNGVVLSLNGGDFNLPASADIRGQLAYIKTSSRFTLPDVESLPALYDLVEDGYFAGWRDEQGNIHDPGTSVLPNGAKYIAVFASNSDMQVTENTKLVFVGGKEVIAEKGKIRECNIIDATGVENLATSVSNGQCILFGLKSSDDIYVPVEVLLTTGETKTYYVRVEYQEGNFADFTADVVDLSAILDYSREDGSSKTVDGAVICDKYTVYPLGSSVGYRNFGSHGSTSLDIWQYRAKSHCENVDHLALCMDPGRPGPKSANPVVYEPDETFDMDNTVFGKVLTHIVNVLIDEGVTENSTAAHDKVMVAAANITTRLVQYFDTSQLASSSTTASGLTTHLAAYKKVGQALASKCSNNLATCSEEKILEALNLWSWNNTEIRTEVARMLVAYDNTGAERIKVDSSGLTNVVDTANAEVTYSTSEINIVVEGKLTGFDSTIDTSKLRLGYSCPELDCRIEDNGMVGNEWHYKYFLRIPNGQIQKFLTLKEARWPAIELDVEGSGMTSANVFVLHAINGANYQRMAIFNTESTTLRAAINFYGALNCKTFYEPGYTGYIPGVIDYNSAEFDPIVFKAAGCCAKIDITTDVYKNYCEEFCTTHNFRNKCDPNSTNPETDVYSLKEGYIDDEKNLTCIVDVTANKSTSMTKTKQKIDFAGNEYTMFSNNYCAISCREEWNIAMPSFNHFVHNGTTDNAVRAGTYFAIYKQNLFLGTKRTCYTSYIDYASYVTEQQNLSKDLIAAYNKLSEYMKVKSEVKRVAEEGRTYVQTYIRDWTFSHTYDCDCVSCGTEESPATCCDTCYSYDPVYDTCTIAYIDLPSSNYAKEAYSSNNNLGDGIVDGAVTSWRENGYLSSSSIGVASSDAVDGGSRIRSRYENGPRPGRKQSSVYSSNEGECCGVGGSNYNCQSFDHNDLKNSATYGGSDVDSNVGAAKNNLKSIRDNMFEKAKAFNNCQNFYLENTSSVTRFTSGSSTSPDRYNQFGGKLFSAVSGVTAPSDTPTASIETKFEPEASYKYEEIFFMNELNKDQTDGKASNYIVPNVEVNGSVANNSCQNINLYDSIDGERLALCNNKTESIVYNENWDPSGEQAKTYTGSDGKVPSASVQVFNIPMCSYSSGDYYDESSNFCTTAQSVIYRAHYITRSLKNSSYYANKGHWYIDKTNDVKSHGDTKQIAISHNTQSMHSKFTVLYGNKYNTFPVALDTPANIYQYSYTFKDIGYFADGEVGRIMGDDIRGMIKNTKRSCFYEIYEELCKCCGDPITWYQSYDSLIDDTESYLDSYWSGNFDKSRDDYTNKSSRFGVVSSTVSLYDMSCKNNLPAGYDSDSDCINDYSNWGSKDAFLYDGKLHSTEKGKQLRDGIVDRGEEIYDINLHYPEYSYTLTPAVMARIKEENGKYRYGYSSSTVDIFGAKVCYDGGIKSSCTLDGEEAGYFHFSSNFLEEDFMVDAITGEFAGNVNHNKSVNSSCVVTNASQAYDKINCRWVDYKTSGGIVLALK